MKKLSIAKKALSHTQSYAYETLVNIYGDKNNDYWDTFNFVYNTKSLKELEQVLADRQHILKSRLDLKGFYNTMKAVCEYNSDIGEYCGTECRGWYRVYGVVKHLTDYFCDMDLARDEGMATQFFNAGAITKAEYDNYHTNITLNMMKSLRFMTNGQPDAKKIMDYWAPEYQNQILDMRLVNAIA